MWMKRLQLPHEADRCRFLPILAAAAPILGAGIGAVGSAVGQEGVGFLRRVGLLRFATGSHLVSFPKIQCAVRVPTAAQAQEVLQ